MRSGFMNRMKDSVHKQDKVVYSHFPGLNIQDKKEEEKDESFFYKYFFFLSIKYYKPYFLMSSSDVYERIMCSIKPWNTNFFDKIHDKPDFYGPFWIYTTLIFALSAAGNFYHYIKVLQSKKKHAKFEYNFKFIPQAFGYVYGYGLIVPTIIYFCFKIFKIEINFPKVFCIYGYAMFPFIIASFICIIPNWLLAWLVILIVLAGQIFFIVTNYWAKVKEIETQSRYIMIGIIAGVQFVCIVAFRIAFFKSVYK